MSDILPAARAMAQTLINLRRGDGPITRDIIASVVDTVMAALGHAAERLDRSAFIADLETAYTVWIGRATELTDNGDHVAWLTAERKQDWRLWARYEVFLRSRLPNASIRALDQETDRILGLLEDPRRPGAWDRRGLVVGHVQSGKTANYIGLINKAADAGYTVIIVLAGLHNNLRSQTQQRLDEGFLGYDSAALRGASTRAPEEIGVGGIDPSIRPDTITDRTETGDFRTARAKGFSINPGRRPLLFVVKKNATVLRNLLDWVRWAANSHDPTTGRRLVIDVPLLVIDDEADHASVDTREMEFGEDGRPDEDHNPTRINALIRQILYAFEKSAYVGYTATPFANIFIHESARTLECGDDLFPRSFIVNLPAPSNYAGPVRIFGLPPADGRDPLPPLPLTRAIPDDEGVGWVPPRHRNGHRPTWNGAAEVPPSLSEAIQAFILACAIRRARGDVREHNSMLVHVTRFTSVQHAVRDQVKAELERIAMRLRLGERPGASSVRQSLRMLFESDFAPATSTVRAEVHDPALRDMHWHEIEPHVVSAASDIRVMEINGTARDVLEYTSHRETGLNVIAIGGDKLARGLTLEGLSVSYFLRASRMYDTLMQMGRWFGYRPGYLDVCRLYTTGDLIAWFEHITEANEELRAEFDHMAAVGGTPRDYGLKVRSHPALLVTSRVKMRHGMDMELSYAGSVSETTVFDTSESVLRQNLDAAGRLMAALGPPDRGVGSPSSLPVRQERPGGAAHVWEGARLWSGRSAGEVLAFLGAVSTHPDAPRANSALLREYIARQNAVGELTEWTIALLSGDGDPHQAGPFQGINAIKRGPRSADEQNRDRSRYVIRRLLAPRDEGIDLDADAWAAALARTAQEPSGGSQQPTTPSGPSLRDQRPATRGLLLLYPLDPKAARVTLPPVGFGISFPGSRTARRITYRVNNTYWQQEIEDRGA
jgi:hypothetical protein